MMEQSIEAFPLSWPVGFERAKVKKYSQFKCTLAQARDGVINEIGRLNGKNVIISSNIPLKKNGDMYGNMKPVDGDHGVAVYFTWKNDQYVLACDTYHYIHENLRAIEKSIEAIRGLERWGASDILSRAFSGFKALGEATETKDNWWDILGVGEDAWPNAIKSAYLSLAKKYHPDNLKTGDKEMFQKIQAAYERGTRK